MSNINEYIRELNLVYTDSATYRDFLAIDKDMSEVEINYKNSISLGNYISMFNDLYKSFREEYDSLKSLNLGKEVVYINFSKWTAEADYRCLSLYVREPNMIKKKGTNLYLREIDGKIMPFATNNGNPIDKNYYRVDVNLDEDLCKQYLDLFEKYKLLLDLYAYARNGQLFGDGVRYIYTKVNDTNIDFLDGLNKFELIFGVDYFSNDLYADIVFNLGDDLSINYEDSKLIVNNADMTLDKKLIDRLLNEIYLKQDYIKERKRK